jgi:hypothetical protein
MNRVSPVTDTHFSIGYNTDRIEASDSRLLALIDRLCAKYHFRAEPIRIKDTDILATITRRVPGSTAGLEEELLEMALSSGFKGAEVFVSVVSDPDYWE